LVRNAQTERRLKAKLGIKDTLCKVKEEDKCTVPTAMTETVALLGNLTIRFDTY